MVAVYWPAMALGGIVTWIWGFQVAVVLPPTLVAVTMSCGVVVRVVAGLVVKVAVPVAWLSPARGCRAVRWS